jgi:hypothetical protein
MLTPVRGSIVSSFGHRGLIPPFSSYGGILGAVHPTAPFFNLALQCTKAGRV